MTITLDALVESLDRSFNQNSAIAHFLPRFVVEDGDVPMEVNGEHKQIPTLNKLTKAINTAAFTMRLDLMEKAGDDSASKIKAIISQLYTISGKNSPFWAAMDLTGNKAIGDTSDPTYRANIENGMRFPFDAYYVSQIDRKDGSNFVKVGKNLLPPYTESIVAGWGDGTVANNNPASLSGASSLDIANYPAFSVTTYYTQYYWNYWYWYYGYYWYYWNYYHQNYAYTYGVTTTTGVSGSQTAQTFIQREDVILTAINIWSYSASSYKNNKPTLLLCETSYGMPDLKKIITTGTVVEDYNYVSGALTSYSSLSRTNATRFNLADPVHIKAGVSYAMVLITPGTYYIWHSNNKSVNGGVFYTQDGSMWTQDLAKDIVYDLVTAQFAPGDNIVEIPALTLSGGIASIKTFVKGVIPPGTDFKLQVAVNSSSWQDLGVLNNLDNLPPYSPVRAVFTCTSKLAPIVDAMASSITAFRPAADLKFISEPISSRVGRDNITLSFTLAGYDTLLHTLSVKIKNTAGNIIEPLWKKENVADKSNGIVDFGFSVPIGGTYRIVVTGKTATATRVFDILNIIEV